MAFPKEKEEISAPLLVLQPTDTHVTELEEDSLATRAWWESKKLWRVVGPAIFTRITNYATIVITQALAGHLGDLELASVSISISVIVGFNLGLLLGMASALETLCGQAFGAKKPHLLGIYMQRSWIVMSLLAFLLLPMYFFATPVLILLGEPEDLAKMAGRTAPWFIPLHFSFVFLFTLNRFLQSQLKNYMCAVAAAVGLVVHVLVSWLLVSKLGLGLPGAVMSLNLSWWTVVVVMLGYVVFGGCPLSWTGLSFEAFVGLWDFLKLSVSSGVMLCLEFWYYKIVILLAGALENAEIAVDALTICMTTNTLEMMIPLAFFAGTGVRVANELGAGNGKGAKFATKVSLLTSLTIGIVFMSLVLGFGSKIAYFYTSSVVVIQAVDKLSLFLALTILLNSVQPILSGVAVGSGWQGLVAKVNIGSYYLLGVPFGVFLGWHFHLGVQGIWAGMLGGTAIQTLILAYITSKCDWDGEALEANTRLGNF